MSPTGVPGPRPPGTPERGSSAGSCCSSGPCGHRTAGEMASLAKTVFITAERESCSSKRGKIF